MTENCSSGCVTAVLHCVCWKPAAFCWMERRFRERGRCFFIVNAIIYFLGTALAFLWGCFVDYKIFGSHERLRRIYPLVAIPAYFIFLLSVVNLFYPVFFIIDQNNIYSRTSLYVFLYLVNYGYLAYGTVLACRHRKQMDQYLFMPVVAFLIPIYIGSVIQLFYYGVALIWPATALSLIFLYINLQNEESFLGPLTNLYNRNFLLHYMGRITQKAKKGIKITGITLDINSFKQINDTYGHIQGDSVLCAVGDLLLRAGGSGAVVARYGGDEFVILLEDAGAEQVQHLHADIQEQLQIYNASGKAPLPITLSAGVAEFDYRDPFSFFQEMDRRMYEEKHTFYLRNGIRKP